MVLDLINLVDAVDNRIYRRLAKWMRDSAGHRDRYEGPQYRSDYKAAMRVLAEMNRHCSVYPSKDGVREYVTDGRRVWRCLGGRFHGTYYWERDTLPDAIVSAWWDDIGNPPTTEEIETNIKIEQWLESFIPSRGNSTNPRNFHGDINATLALLEAINRSTSEYRYKLCLGPSNKFAFRIETWRGGAVTELLEHRDVNRVVIQLWELRTHTQPKHDADA